MCVWVCLADFVNQWQFHKNACTMFTFIYSLWGWISKRQPVNVDQFQKIRFFIWFLFWMWVVWGFASPVWKIATYIGLALFSTEPSCLFAGWMEAARKLRHKKWKGKMSCLYSASSPTSQPIKKSLSLYRLSPPTSRTHWLPSHATSTAGKSTETYGRVKR